jgi:hypothetical protein
LELLASEGSLLWGDHQIDTLAQATQLYRASQEQTEPPICHVLVSSTEEAQAINQQFWDLGAGTRVRTIYPLNAVAESSQTPLFLPPGRLGTVIAKHHDSCTISFDNKPDALIVHVEQSDWPMLAVSIAMTVRAAQGLAADSIIWAITAPVNGPTAVSASSRHRYHLTMVVNRQAYVDKHALATDLGTFPIKPILVDLVGHH